MRTDAAGRSSGALRMIVPLLRPRNRRAIWTGIALAVAAQTMQAMLPLVQSVIMDDAILSHRRPLATWVAVLLGAGLLSFTGNYLRRSVAGRAAVRGQRDLQVRVHRHMQHLD